MFKTTTRKNFHNEWVIRSVTMLDEERSLQLTITTTRNSSKQLVSYALVDTVNKDTNTTSHIVHSDFYINIASSSPKRLTLKLVEEQHSCINTDIVVNQAKEFYSL